ncbi:unnamed protein product [Prunus armeniaca]
MSARDFSPAGRGCREARSTEEALRKEINRVDYSPFTDEALQERHDPVQGRRRPDVQSVRDDSARSNSRLVPHFTVRVDKELAIIFTKEYTSYKTVRKHADHLFNLHKKPDESLRDYLRRFKAEKANIVGCNDQVAPSAFKKGLPTQHELYWELAITPSQTLVEVFETAKRYALWEDDRITQRKPASKLITSRNRQAKRATSSSKKPGTSLDRGPQEGGSETGTLPSSLSQSIRSMHK